MSHYDYAASQELAAGDPPFAALIMAAMRRADSTNAQKLQRAFPEVWEELQTRYHTPGGMTPEDTQARREHNLGERVYSRDPEHQADDLHASLEFAAKEGVLPSDAMALTMLESMSRGMRDVLIGLAERTPLAFGLVARFHLEGRTSLLNSAEIASHRVLHPSGGLGLGPRDIGWPRSILSWDYDDDPAAPEDPELDARLAEAIAAWKTAHQDD